MRLIVARRAERAILAIWDWDEERYGSAHATRYTDALRERIASLGNERNPGRTVGDDPTLRYVPFRQRSGRHGHIIVVELSDDLIVVTGVYHTAQDWRTRLEEL